MKGNSPKYLSGYLKENSNYVYNIKLLTKLLQILLERELENLRTYFFHFTFLSGTNLTKMSTYINILKITKGIKSYETPLFSIHEPQDVKLF